MKYPNAAVVEVLVDMSAMRTREGKILHAQLAAAMGHTEPLPAWEDLLDEARQGHLTHIRLVDLLRMTDVRFRGDYDHDP